MKATQTDPELPPSGREELHDSPASRLSAMVHAALVRPNALRRRSLPERYLWALLLLAAGTAFNFLLRLYIAPVNMAMVYLLVVVVTAAFAGRGPSILAAVLGVLVLDFFFVPPHLTLRVADTQYLLTFIGLLSVGLVISELTARVRDQAEAAERREMDTAALFGLSRDLTVAGSIDAILKALTTHIDRIFQRDVVLYIPSPANPELLQPYTQSAAFRLDQSELEAAAWTFEHDAMAGRGSSYLPDAEARYLPLRTPQGIVGVVAVRPREPLSKLIPEQLRLLEACANQAAQAIARVELADRAGQIQVMQATEKLQTALLNSISHDLRTPLVTITGALSMLKETEDGELTLQEEEGNSLVETAYLEAVRLNRLVGNLLNMTRLEAGALKVTREEADVQDVIGSALEQLRERLGNRPVQVDVPAGTPPVRVDFVLIVQVLVNMIDNALKYSPEGTRIEIAAQVTAPYLEIQVADRGLGIPLEDLPHVFDKFYRVRRPGNVAGTGLGLSICKGIAEAHGGRMRAENQPGGGALVTLSLPLGAGEVKNE